MKTIEFQYVNEDNFFRYGKEVYQKREGLGLSEEGNVLPFPAKEPVEDLGKTPEEGYENEE